MNIKRLCAAAAITAAVVGGGSAPVHATDDPLTAETPVEVFSRFVLASTMADFPQGVRNMFGPDTLFGGVFYMTTDIDPTALNGYQKVFNGDGDPVNIVPVFCVLESAPFDLSRSQVAPGAVLPLDLYDRFDPTREASVTVSSPSEDRASAVASDGATLLVAGSTQAAETEFPATAADGFIDRFTAEGVRTRVVEVTTGTNVAMAAVAVHPDGGFVAAGSGDGDFDGPSQGGSDVFVIRFADDGTVVWTTAFGSAGDDTAAGVVVSTVDGSITVSGTVAGSLPTQTSAGGSDVFAARLASDGSTQWVRQWGTSGNDRLLAAHSAVIDDGQIVVGTTDDVWPSTPGPNAGGVDAFVEKLAADGATVWASQFGSAGQDTADAVTVAADGAVVTAGSTTGDVFEPNSGGTDILVRQSDSDGTGVTGLQFGSPTDDAVAGVSLVDGDVVVVGSTTGVIGDASLGADDMFIRRIAGDGSTVWSNQFGSDAVDTAAAMATFDGSLVVVGSSTGDVATEVNRGAADAAAARFTVDGTLEWVRQWGASTVTTVADTSVATFTVPTTPTVQDLSVVVEGVDRDGNPLRTVDRYAVVPAYASKPLSAARSGDPAAVGAVRWLAPRISVYDAGGVVTGVVSDPDDPSAAVGVAVSDTVPFDQRMPVEMAAGQLAIWQLLSGLAVDDPAGPIEVYRASTRDTLEQILGQGGTFMSEPTTATLDEVAQRASSLVAVAVAADVPAPVPHAFDVVVGSDTSSNPETVTVDVEVTSTVGTVTGPAVGVGVTATGAAFELSAVTDTSGRATFEISRELTDSVVTVTASPVLPAGSLLAAADDSGPASTPQRLLQQVVTARDVVAARSVEVGVPAQVVSPTTTTVAPSTTVPPATDAPTTTVPPTDTVTDPNELPTAGNRLGWWLVVLTAGFALGGLWLRRRPV